MLAIARILCVSLLCLGALPSVTWAQSDAMPTESQLLGRWRSTARAADGQVLTAEIELKRDQRFSGRASVSGELLMTYAGNWRLQDNIILWRYLKSDPATPAQSRSDSDEVTSLTARTLVITSARTGITTTLTRVD
jgi:hypothetical protein